MNSAPCRYCVPPARKPGCCCEAKRAWDKQQAAARAARLKDGEYYGYASDNIRAMERRK